MDRTLGFAEGWIQSACGVRTRQVRIEETQEGMAAEAVMEALRASATKVDEIDAIICAQAVPRQPIPSMAPLVAARIGMPIGKLRTFDVNSTCLSFVTALETAVGCMTMDPRCGTVVIVSSEIPSAGLPWSTDPATAGLFGDGACAVVLRRDDEGAAIVASRFETHHDGYELCQLKSGGTALDPHAAREAFEAGTRFSMDARGLFRLVARRMPDFVSALLAEAGWAPGDVDLVVPHQASALALRHMAVRCGFLPGRIVDIVEDHGNQISASIPTALHLAMREGRIGPGAKVLMMGTSAGVMFGGLALQFP